MAKRDKDEGQMTMVRYGDKLYDPYDFYNARIEPIYNEETANIDWAIILKYGQKIYTAPNKDICNAEFNKIISLLIDEGIDIIDLNDGH